MDTPDFFDLQHHLVQSRNDNGYIRPFNSLSPPMAEWVPLGGRRTPSPQSYSLIFIGCSSENWCVSFCQQQATVMCSPDRPDICVGFMIFGYRCRFASFLKVQVFALFSWPVGRSADSMFGSAINFSFYHTNPSAMQPIYCWCICCFCVLKTFDLLRRLRWLLSFILNCWSPTIYQTTVLPLFGQ